MDFNLNTIEKIREQKEWTHAEMAEKIGISPRTWRRVRNVREWKPSDETMKKIAHTQRVYVGVYKRKIKIALREIMPTIDNKFNVFSTKKRAYVAFRVSFKGIMPFTSADASDIAFEEYFIKQALSRVMMSHGAKYLYNAKIYGIEYVNLRIDVIVNSEKGTYERSYPAYSEWIGDSGKEAIENALRQIYDSICVSLLAQYEGFKIHPVICDVSCVTIPTKAEIDL